MTKPQLRLIENPSRTPSICAQCQHVRNTHYWDREIKDSVYWNCGHNNGTDPVTGGPIMVPCQHKNPYGECQGFDRYDPPPPWWRRILKWVGR